MDKIFILVSDKETPKFREALPRKLYKAFFFSSSQELQDTFEISKEKPAILIASQTLPFASNQGHTNSASKFCLVIETPHEKMKKIGSLISTDQVDELIFLPSSVLEIQIRVNRLLEDISNSTNALDQTSIRNLSANTLEAPLLETAVFLASYQREWLRCHRYD